MTSVTPTTATITGSRPLTGTTTLYTLQCAETFPACSVASFLPGQFLQLSLPGSGEVPISYCGSPSPAGTIELCIRHTGHVTTPLQRALPGAVVGLRGPFGRGFPLDSYEGQDLLLIAGGLGMAPLRSLLLALLRQRERWSEITLLFAAREVGALLFLPELLELRQQGIIRLQLAIDRPGQEVENPPDCRVALLAELLDELTIRPEQTYAALCGPPVVYPALVSGLKNMRLADERIHLSLERRMKCGIGKCGHCAVGTLLCCTDGPVFSYARLQGIEGALL